MGREFQFWAVDFNFDVQAHNSDGILMARCVVFMSDDESAVRETR